jgi:chromosomal replication initiator protein
MLDRLTGGWYRSTPHRVRNLSGHGRLSFPFFLDPGFDAEVPPLPDRAAAGDDGGRRWDGLDLRAFTGSYGDYLLGKVSKVFPQLRSNVLGLDRKLPRPAGCRGPAYRGGMTGTLVPQYTFETLDPASTGRFAHACAVAAAEAPGTACNPLLIHGGLGPERTHLLHAIGNYGQTLWLSLRVRYVRAAEFASEFAAAVRNGEQDDFRNGYLGIDMLLVDNIQDLESQQDVQEDLLRIFTTLRNGTKQVVISSDRAPSRLAGLGDRLRAQFGIEDGLRGQVGQAMVAEIEAIEGRRRSGPPM